MFRLPRNGSERKVLGQLALLSIGEEDIFCSASAADDWRLDEGRWRCVVSVRTLDVSSNIPVATVNALSPIDSSLRECSPEEVRHSTRLSKRWLRKLIHSYNLLYIYIFPNFPRMIITIPRRERLEPSVNGILGPKSRVCSSNVDQAFVLHTRPLYGLYRDSFACRY